MRRPNALVHSAMGVSSRAMSGRAALGAKAGKHAVDDIVEGLAGGRRQGGLYLWCQHAGPGCGWLCPGSRSGTVGAPAALQAVGKFSCDDPCEAGGVFANPVVKLHGVGHRGSSFLI